MWMMGYNDGVELNSINQDSFNGRNIPLVRTTACSRISGTDLLALNHNLAMGGGGDRNKRELNNGGTTKQQVVVSTRWNPTPEQIQTLEELYRRGTRTPSAEEIQHITAQLRRYGKIEGKNVFYWFQNHKARERQKRRRQLDHDDQVVDEPPTHNYSTQCTHHHVQNKESSSPEENGTVIFEVEESKNWASPTNSISTILAEKNVATQGAEAAADAECKSDGWLQFDHAQRNATWHIISSPYPPVSTCIEPCILENSDHSAAAAAAAGDAQTLQLFPLGSGGGCEDEKEEEEESGSAAMNDISDDVIPYQFFEFLPLKN